MDAVPHPETLHTLIALTIISATSVIGSASFVLGRYLERVLPYLIALAGGTLLGTAGSHLLPEAMDRLGSRKTGLLFLAGLLGSFLLERLLMSLFQHTGPCHHSSALGSPTENFHHSHEHQHHSGNPLVANILLSGAIHSFVDGVAIAVAFRVAHPIGIATTIAVLLHEVPHHIADVGILIYAGLRRRRAVLLNLIATAGCATGGVLILVTGLRSASLTFSLLPITAANFLYIGLAILIPELQREQSRRRSFWQVTSLFGGAIFMNALSRWVPDS